MHLENRTHRLSVFALWEAFFRGIDLQNEAVIGVIIVGTGLPQTGSRQEILKVTMKKKEKWFLFAYLYPNE